MNQFAILNAAQRIDGYFNPTPDEIALGKQVGAFIRAQTETIKHLRNAIEETEKLSVDDFFRITNRSLLLAHERDELKGSVGKHDWVIGKKCEDGYPVFVDDRQLSYRSTPSDAMDLALTIIARLQHDGDYRLNDKPAGFSPPPLPDSSGFFNVRLVMENGCFHDWQGQADDENHAEGQAIADATSKTGEQVFDVVSLTSLPINNTMKNL